MILKAILCVQHFCSFCAMLFLVNLHLKTDSATVICAPCMLERVCYQVIPGHGNPQKRWTMFGGYLYYSNIVAFNTRLSPGS